MAAEPPNQGRLVLIALLVLLPAGLAAGWLVGRVPVPAAAPEAVKRLPPPDPVVMPHEATPATVSPVAVASQDAKPEKKPEVLSAWTTYADAVAQSRASGKPVLIDFNAEWCGPCQRLKANVFDDPVRGHDVQLAVIPVSIVDRRHEDGQNPAEIEMLQARYNVHAFPTVVIFDPATGRSEQQRGFGGAEDMVQWIQQTATRVK